MMNRTTPDPTSSITSRRVTNVPARLDMRTGSPLSNRFTSCVSFTSSVARSSLSARTAAVMRLT
jgi:hypothetical protein